ncbi:MAG TPA: TetR/AcrR family transcriptional regulator [Pseudonocardiaceae bacterium]
MSRRGDGPTRSLAEALATEPVDLKELVRYIQFAAEHPAHFQVMYRSDLYHNDDPALAADDPDESRERRKDRRRHGAVLDRAIFEATMTELAEVGYCDFSIERVAGRAGTGKATVYRCWAGRAELVAAAVRDSVAAIVIADSVDLRVDLLALFSAAAEVLNGPAGEAARGLVADTRRTPALALALRSSVARIRARGGDGDPASRRGPWRGPSASADPHRGAHRDRR